MAAYRFFFKNHESMCILAVCAVPMLVMLAAMYLTNNIVKEDITNFYGFGEMMVSGMVPYKDFVFEFPPVSLIFFLIPSCFTSDIETYALIYGIQVIFFMLLTLWFMLRIADKAKIGKIPVTLIFMAFALVYLDHGVVKLDMMAAALTAASVYLFLEKRYASSYAVMTFAALIKMYPALLILVFIVANLCERGAAGKTRAVIKGAAACAAAGLLSMLPFLMMSVSFGEVLSFIGFHSGRGFHIESLPGVIIQGLAHLGLTTIEIVPANSTHDVIGPLCDALLPSWMAFCAVLILSAFIIIFKGSRMRSGINIRTIASCSVLVLTVFMLTNKVFSTQYIMWLYPFLPFLAVRPGGGIDRKAAMLFILTMIFSSLILIAGDLFVAVNLIRDAMLIGIAVMMSASILGKGAGAGREAEAGSG